jgi:TonB family protein
MNSFKKYIDPLWLSFFISILLHVVLLSLYKNSDDSVEKVMTNIFTHEKKIIPLEFSPQGESKNVLSKPKKEKVMMNQSSENVLANESINIPEPEKNKTQQVLSNFSEQKYLRELRKMLEAQIKYPELARKRELEGIVYLSVNINKNGEILNHKIVKESGITLLDEAALRTIKQLVFFKAFPVEMKSESIEFQFPMTYKLNN